MAFPLHLMKTRGAESPNLRPRRPNNIQIAKNSPFQASTDFFLFVMKGFIKLHRAPIYILEGIKTPS